MLRDKGPQKPEVAHDVVRIHSFMVYTNLIEYNIVFSFVSKLKSGGIVTTGQYMNYQTNNKLPFRPLLKLLS